MEHRQAALSYHASKHFRLFSFVLEQSAFFNSNKATDKRFKALGEQSLPSQIVHCLIEKHSRNCNNFYCASDDNADKLEAIMRPALNIRDNLMEQFGQKDTSRMVHFFIVSSFHLPEYTYLQNFCHHSD